MVLSGVQPLRDVHNVAAMQGLSCIGVFVSNRVASRFLFSAEAVADVIGCGVAFDFRSVDGPRMFGLDGSQHVKP